MEEKTTRNVFILPRYHLGMVCFILILIMGVLWWNTLDFYHRRKEAVLNSWMELEMQMVRVIAKAAGVWMAMRIHDRDVTISEAEQEVVNILVKPVILLQNGDAWLYNRSYKVYDKNSVMDSELADKTLREGFERQRQAGAYHFDMLYEGIDVGMEGTDWYVWTSQNGREYAAWTPIRVGNDLWTLGISTPESEIIEHSGINTAFRREIGSSMIITGLILAVFFLDWYQRRRNQIILTEMEHTAAKLAASNNELTKLLNERKQVEMELERLISELEEKNAETEEFTYTVSHDLRSPLITIVGFLGLLEQENIQPHDARSKRYIDRIRNAATHMQHLLDGLLDLMRVGRKKNPTTEFSFKELVQEALELIFRGTPSRSVQIDVASEFPTVYGDRTRLLQVIQNLVDNALKFMGDQSQPRIEIGYRQDNGITVYYIKDNGIGIDPQYHEKIFGLFERLDTRIQGTGIGLTILKRIIDEHGGRIWVESEGSGKGSTFCFTLHEKQISIFL